MSEQKIAPIAVSRLHPTDRVGTTNERPAFNHFLELGHHGTP
jgi:hypothetical protein